MTCLIAYDIADPKRLARVARTLERHAQRCQKSVFLFEGAATELRRLWRRLRERIDPSTDIVQAWRLVPGQPLEGDALGRPAWLAPHALVLGSPEPADSTW